MTTASAREIAPRTIVIPSLSRAHHAPVAERMKVVLLAELAGDEGQGPAGEPMGDVHRHMTEAGERLRPVRGEQRLNVHAEVRGGRLDDAADRDPARHIDPERVVV
jgi:hypothetical protein